ncbi:MAG: hypothetical protein GWN58_49725, partial [Anaerolineae bacterium]|nr:hypothetical protein [Anaerolineae bacterium]
VGELWVMDDGGTTTQLSPHDPATGKRWEHSYNIFTGIRRAFKSQEWEEAIDAAIEQELPIAQWPRKADYTVIST